MKLDLIPHANLCVVTADGLSIKLRPSDQARGDAITKGEVPPQEIDVDLPPGTVLRIVSVSKIMPKVAMCELPSKVVFPFPLDLLMQVVRPVMVQRQRKPLALPAN